jgi:hypothetical protein
MLGSTPNPNQHPPTTSWHNTGEEDTANELALLPSPDIPVPTSHTHPHFWGGWGLARYSVCSCVARNPATTKEGVHRNGHVGTARQCTVHKETCTRTLAPSNTHAHTHSFSFVHLPQPLDQLHATTKPDILIIAVIAASMLFAALNSHRFRWCSCA